jgi:hypothetical protein
MHPWTDTAIYRTVAPKRLWNSKVYPQTNCMRPLELLSLLSFSFIGEWIFQQAIAQLIEDSWYLRSVVPRRRESLTIYWRCQCKGSSFSSSILSPWVEVRPRIEPSLSAWKANAVTTTPFAWGPQLWCTHMVSFIFEQKTSRHGLERCQLKSSLWIMTTPLQLAERLCNWCKL